VAVRQSRFSLLNVLRNRPVWVDGYLSSCDFRRKVANGHIDVLVDDAGIFGLNLKRLHPGLVADRRVDWDVFGALDGVSNQLVVSQDWGQGAMRVIPSDQYLYQNWRL